MEGMGPQMLALKQQAAAARRYNRPSRDRTRRATPYGATPYGSRDSSQGGNHIHHHLVHCSGAGQDSSDEEEEDEDERVEETVSFEEMLEQARSQSDRYSDIEDSDDKDFEPYVIHYEDYYVGYEASHTAVATAELDHSQEGKVCAFTNSDCTARQKPCVGSGGGCCNSGCGMSMARSTSDMAACDAANATAAVAPTSGYSTRPHQLSEASHKGQQSFTTSRKNQEKERLGK